MESEYLLVLQSFFSPLRETFSQPAFYMQLLILSLTAGLSVLISAYILRRKRNHALRRLRIQLSADLHDDVGSLLTGIAMQAELLALSAEQGKASKMNRLAAMSREAQYRLRDNVWIYDSRRDDWQSLLNRLHNFAQEVLEPRGVQFEIKLEGINTKKVIPMQLRKELYLIAKEVITNVSRHSNASLLVFRLQQSCGQFKLDIQDNGRIDESASTEVAGLGLSNIKMRAKRLGAKMEIDLRQGFGIHLQMPSAA